MTGEDVKQNATLTINWLTANVPTIAAIIGVGLYIGTWQTSIQATLTGLQADTLALKAQLHTMQVVPYRVDQAEAAIRDVNTRVDNLSNTIINQMDLIRRDVNRLTTEVEVLSSRVGILTGDIEEPKQRRSRPGPNVDAPEQ
jgi:hypothetical protein